jgi:hypothetical protein
MADVGRHLYGPVGRNVALGRVAAERENGGDTVADLDVGHAGPDRGDIARALIAGDERIAARGRVRAVAEIDVDEVDARGTLLDANLALARRREVDVLVGENLSTARLVNTHRRNHGILPVLRALWPRAGPGS